MLWRWLRMFQLQHNISPLSLGEILMRFVKALLQVQLFQRPIAAVLSRSGVIYKSRAYLRVPLPVVR